MRPASNSGLSERRRDPHGCVVELDARAFRNGSQTLNQIGALWANSGVALPAARSGRGPTCLQSELAPTWMQIGCARRRHPCDFQSCPPASFLPRPTRGGRQVEVKGGPDVVGRELFGVRLGACVHGCWRVLRMGRRRSVLGRKLLSERIDDHLLVVARERR